MQKIFSIFFILVISLGYAYSHVGSPDVIMQGYAGNYKILVTVKPPDVIPGIANVIVYVQSGTINSVSGRAIYFYSGESGAPPAEQMNAVAGQSGQYTANVWLMNSGSSSIQVTVDGSEGKGQIIVPVVALSTAKRDMPSSTGWLLAAFGVFLFVLLVTIIGSSVSDALTKKDELMPSRRKKIRVIALIVATILTSFIVYAGNAWWQSWADDYNRFLFKPGTAFSTIEHKDGVNHFRFALDTNSQNSNSFSYIVHDHGKMMHMFIMRIPAMDAFAHLHPIRLDSANFTTILPGLPKGKYLAFADVVYSSGFTETIKDTFEIAADITDSLHKLDPDDAYAFAMPVDTRVSVQLPGKEDVIICGKPGTGVKLKDGSVMMWEDMTDDAFETGKLYQFKFIVLGPDKQPAKLEPYLGMGGHAAIVRKDGNVYIHIHPVGTYSITAENNLLKRIAGPRGIYVRPDRVRFRDSIDRYEKYLKSLDEKDRENQLMQQMGMPVDKGPGMNSMDHSNMVEFPYSFPSPGEYRIWVQVKRNGQVLTAAFDKTVL